MDDSRRPHVSFRAPLLVTALALTSLLPAPAARAQVATVESGPSLMAHLLNQVNTLTVQFQDYYEYGQQAMRWKATWDHYYQQIARFINRVRNPLMSNKVNFDYVAVDYGVQQKCGGTGGFSFSLSSLAHSAVPDFSGDIQANQRKICAQIQMLENQKYNATVRYFKEVAPILKQDMEAISAQREANNEQGTLQAIMEASQRLTNQQATSGKDLENQIDSCDRLIAALTIMQRNLARQALKGKPDVVLGTLVKTATLEAALKAK